LRSAQLVPDFSAADQDALCGSDFAIGNNPLEPRAEKKKKNPQSAKTHRGGATCSRREYHQRLAPAAQRLPAQQLKILRGVRRLANLNVVLGGELQITFDPRA